MNDFLRIAIICASIKQAELTKIHLLPFGAFNFVHTGKDLKTDFRKMTKEAPDIVLVDMSSMQDNYREIDPSFGKLRRFLPEVKIIIRTGLNLEHNFIREANENGAIIIDERLDYPKIAETLQKASTAEEPFIRYESRTRHDILGHSAHPSHYETTSLNPISLRKGRERI